MTTVGAWLKRKTSVESRKDCSNREGNSSRCSVTMAVKYYLKTLKQLEKLMVLKNTFSDWLVLGEVCTKWRGSANVRKWLGMLWRELM